jgi:DNA invertase Pin-like site-specific DNA recombinase
MKVYTYSRTSTNKQETSIDVQKQALENYCERQGFTNPIHLVDSDVSGGISLLKRPQGGMLEQLESGDYVIFYKHDRAVRSTEDGIRLVKKWFYKGVNIVFLNISEQPINISNPAAKFSFFVMLCAAELEKDMIGQRTKDGLQNRRVNGKTNSAPKFGYTNVGKGKDGIEVVNEDEIKAIIRMNELRQNNSAYVVARKLNEEGFLTKKGRVWQGSNIDTMLRRSKERGLI